MNNNLAQIKYIFCINFIITKHHTQPRSQKPCSYILIKLFIPTSGVGMMGGPSTGNREEMETNKGPAGFHFADQFPRSGFCSLLPFSSGNFLGSFKFLREKGLPNQCGCFLLREALYFQQGHLKKLFSIFTPNRLQVLDSSGPDIQTSGFSFAPSPQCAGTRSLGEFWPHGHITQLLQEIHEA